MDHWETDANSHQDTKKEFYFTLWKLAHIHESLSANAASRSTNQCWFLDNLKILLVLYVTKWKDEAVGPCKQRFRIYRLYGCGIMDAMVFNSNY